MAQHLRNTVAILILLTGIMWTLSLEPGWSGIDSEPATFSAADLAEFRVAAFRGTLSIVGHSRSKHHEQSIIDAAKEHFPTHSTEAEFRPLGVAPAWWDSATLALVASVAAMESPDAYLTEDALRIRALVFDEPGAEQRLEALRQSIPSSTDIDVQLTAIDASPTVARFCGQRFSAFRAGHIAFEESGTDMRASAYPALDSVVALADACRNATLTITGHTDSTGSEVWNQQLSLARAKAVAAYLGSRGIAMERLVVVGAGSSVPIADNATRYGRSINRRIDIQFTATSD